MHTFSTTSSAMTLLFIMSLLSGGLVSPQVFRTQGITDEEIVDNFLSNTQVWLNRYGDRFNVESVGNIVQSCKVEKNEKVGIEGRRLFIYTICMNVTKLATISPKVTVEHAKFVMKLTLQKKPVTDVRVKLEAPVVQGMYIHILGTAFRAESLAPKLVSQIEEALQKQFREFSQNKK